MSSNPQETTLPTLPKKEGDITYPSKGRSVGAYKKAVDVDDNRLSNYESATSSSTVPLASRRVSLSTIPQKPSPASTPAQRDAVRRSLIAASNETIRMETFAETGDLIELSNAGFSLKNILSDLWVLRKEREDDWRDILNILQAAISQEEFEKFTPEQCRAIRTIIVDCLGPRGTDVDDLRDSVKLLRRVGFDPWKGISNGKQSDTQSE